MSILGRKPEHTANFIQKWIKGQVKEAGAKGAILGLSGGVDSSVLAVLLRRTFGKKMLGIAMPCHSDPEDLAHAKLLTEKFDIPNYVYDLTKIYDEYIKKVSKLYEISKLAEANTKSRLRMVTLYVIGQPKKYLICGTSNKSEYTIGYFTKYGDSGSDLLPLADLLKAEIYELAEYLDIPEEIVKKPPSAGLWDGQTDEDEIGLPYSVIDHFIATGEADAAAVEKINLMNSLSAHKRAVPPICVIN
ncbi:MAG: NAD(+) synthase [Synergistaceae bacterium]|nr:NAD(+) synthase [Synergistaceae bacterium]